MRLAGPQFSERWDNEKALEIGIAIGRGMSPRAVCDERMDGTTEESIRSRLQKIGYRALDENSEVAVVVEFTVRQRALVHQRAIQRCMSMGEYIRRLAVCASRQRATYDQIVAEDQFT